MYSPDQFTRDITDTQIVTEASTLGISPEEFPPKEITIGGIKFLLTYADTEQAQYQAEAVIFND